MKYNYKFCAFITAIIFLLNVVLCIGINASSSTTSYTIGIKNNTVYYLMNAATSRLLYSNTSSSSDYANVRMVGKTSSNWASNSTKWELNRLSSGSFEIYGGAGYGAILKVIDDYDIETETNEGGTNTKFILTRSTDSFQGTYTIMNNGKYLTYNANNNSLYLRASSPNDFSYWSLMAVERGAVDLYTFTYTYTQNNIPYTYNTSQIGSDFEDRMNLIGYSSAFHLNNYHDPSAIPGFMQDDDIFIFFWKGCSE